MKCKESRLKNRILGGFLVVTMFFSFTACGGTSVEELFANQSYSELGEVYANLNAEEKNSFKEMAENHFSDLVFTDSMLEDDAISLCATGLGTMKELELESELLDTLYEVVYTAAGYISEQKELPSAYSPIPDDFFEKAEPIAVYITNRVKSSENEGEYLDYYVAYPYHYDDFWSEAIPHTDEPAVILECTTALSKGMFNDFAIEAGTYDTVSDDGFEHTNLLYKVYSSEDWAKDEQASFVKQTKDIYTGIIEELMVTGIQMVEEGRYEDARKLVQKYSNVPVFEEIEGTWEIDYERGGMPYQLQIVCVDNNTLKINGTDYSVVKDEDTLYAYNPQDLYDEYYFYLDTDNSKYISLDYPLADVYLIGFTKIS